MHWTDCPHSQADIEAEVDEPDDNVPSEEAEQEAEEDEHFGDVRTPGVCMRSIAGYGYVSLIKRGGRRKIYCDSDDLDEIYSNDC